SIVRTVRTVRMDRTGHTGRTDRTDRTDRTGAGKPLGEAVEAQIQERIATRKQRVHILTGAVCNNNCIFCMEEDRDARYVTNSATTDEVVRWILDQNRGCEEICFTSGEPTTNPRLP